MAEDKEPKGSFSKLVVGNLYTPADPIAAADLQASIQKGLAAFLTKHLPSYGHPVAVITGTIRQAWSEASPENKSAFEDVVKAVLEPLGVKPFGESYFLPQDKEGELEYEATRNLVRTVDPTAEVVMCCGIGMGSVQLVVEGFTVSLPFGMNNPALLTGSGANSLQSALKDRFLGNPDVLQKLIDKAEDAERPVIAFKSGLLIGMTKIQELMQLLVLDCVQTEAKAEYKVGYAQSQCFKYLENGRIQFKLTGFPQLSFCTPSAAPFQTVNFPVYPQGAITVAEGKPLPQHLVETMQKLQKKEQEVNSRKEGSDKEETRKIKERDDFELNEIKQSLSKQVDPICQEMMGIVKATTNCCAVTLHFNGSGLIATDGSYYYLAPNTT